VTNSKILINQWRNEPSSRDRLGHHLAFTKSAQEPGNCGEVCPAGVTSKGCRYSSRNVRLPPDLYALLNGGVTPRSKRSLYTSTSEIAPTGRPLLDADQVRVFARLVVLGAAQDQSFQHHVGSLNDMEVLILLHGTGRDHGLGTPGYVADDG
jgi:hypothetical protein